MFIFGKIMENQNTLYPSLLYQTTLSWSNYYIFCICKNRVDVLLLALQHVDLLNIASDSEANITTSCEMEIFNFLWLTCDHYLPLAPT